MNEELQFPDITATAVVSTATTMNGLTVTGSTIKDAALVPFKRAESDLRALATRYSNVAFDLTTGKGLGEAKAARLDLRENGRFAIQRARDKFKSDVNEAKAAVDDQAERLIAIVKPVEDQVHSQITAHEERVAAEKAEKARAEAQRVANHEAGIAVVRRYADLARGLPAERIARGIAALEAMQFGPEWEEFQVPAANAQCETIQTLKTMHAAAAAAEDAERQREAQRVENERVAAELAAQRAKIEAEAEAFRKRVAAFDAEQEAARNAAAQQNGAAPPIEPVKPDTGAAMQQAAVSAASEGSEVNAGTRTGAAPPVAGAVQALAEHIPPAPATIRLGEIADRLGFVLTESFVTGTLGVKKAGMDKRFVLFLASDWLTIKAALVKHIETLA